MTELDKLLQQVKKTTTKAKEDLNNQRNEIEKIQDPLVKQILKNAIEKAESGDVEGVKSLIQTLQDANRS